MQRGKSQLFAYVPFMDYQGTSFSTSGGTA